MTANKPSTTDHDWIDEDDAPDPSTPEWRTKFAQARCGRPKAEAPKVSTTIWLDADIVKHFQAPAGSRA